MALGHIKHELWPLDQGDRCPAQELGGWTLTAPVTEQKYQTRIPASDDLDILLRGVPDCLDGPKVHEWTSGLTSASSCVDSLQID